MRSSGTTLLFQGNLVAAGDNAAFSIPFVNLSLGPEAALSRAFMEKSQPDFSKI